MVRNSGVYFETDEKENKIGTVIPIEGFWLTIKTNMRYDYK